VLAGKIHTDSIALASRMDTLLKHVCDSVQECVTDLMGDTLKAYTTSDKIDTLLGDYVTNVHLNDTLSHYYDTTLMKKAIHDTANVLRELIPVVNNGQITIRVDNQGTETTFTFGVNQADNLDITIPASTQISNLRDSVNRVVLDSLYAANSAMNKAIDTIAGNNIHDGQLHVITYGATKLDTTKLFSANQLNNDTLNLSRYALLDTLRSFYATTKALTDSLDSLKKDIRKVDNTLMPKECSLKKIMGQNQEVNDSTFTLTSVPHSAYLVKIYINGVLVGDNDNSNGDAVLIFDSENKQIVKYRSYFNKDDGNNPYKLEEGDRVFIYWFSSPIDSSSTPTEP
jgi:hypothetical protein